MQTECDRALNACLDAGDARRFAGAVSRAGCEVAGIAGAFVDLCPHVLLIAPPGLVHPGRDMLSCASALVWRDRSRLTHRRDRRTAAHIRRYH